MNKHHVQARIPELNNNQDRKELLVYIEQNNLYGSALCRPLPHSEFSWVEDDALEKFATNPQDILNLDDEGDYGYLFEVDLEYPKELHAITGDFPLAPESGRIEDDMFSPFMKSFYHDLCAARACDRKYHPTQVIIDAVR